MVINNNLCKTVLLDDVPAKTDEFGPHKRVADAITNLIETEPGGRVIGLEGGWGAGKSTVVNFVKAALSASKNNRVVTFDAWAHEGDPLRRTFLENVIENLEERDWLDKEKRDVILSEISHRNKVTDTEVSSKPTRLGKLFAISLLPIAPCAVLLSHSLKSWPAWVSVALGLLTFAPLIVLICYGLSIVINGKSSDSASEDEDWSFLLKSTRNKTRTKSTESPNPTSIEFERNFTKAMKGALGDYSDRRMVLVLDNLDRVAAADAIAVWSTLQTFLKERDRGRESWFEQIWVIVPYDPIGIRRLWDRQSDGSGENKEVVSNSFLDKSFQLRFQVPPPVLSGWKTYLYGLVKEALPGHADDDTCHQLYLAYDLFRDDVLSMPTPRGLKLYVNQVGVIHRQWRHQFPLQHVAFYVLKCNALNQFIRELRSPDFPGQDAKRLLGEELKRSLAGLAFNVPAEQGIELLLSGPLYDSLATGDHKELVAIIKENESGALAVLEGVMSGRLYEAEPLVIANASATIFNATAADGANPIREWADVLQQLSLAIKKTKLWTPFDEGVASGIQSALRLFDDRGFTSEIMLSVSSTVAEAGKAGDITGKSILKSVIAILNTIADLHFMDCVERISIPGDAKGWVDACSEVIRSPRYELLCKSIRPTATSPEISTVVTSAIDAGTFNTGILAALEVTNLCLDEVDWSEVTESFQRRLDPNANPSLDEGEIGSLLEGLWLLRKFGTSSADRVLEELVASGRIDHYYNQVGSTPDSESAALCMLSILRWNLGVVAPPGIGNSAAGYQLLVKVMGQSDRVRASALCSIIEEYGEFGLIFDVTDERGRLDPFVAICFHIFAESDSKSSVFTPKRIVSRWLQIEEGLRDVGDQQCFGRLLKCLIDEHGLCEEVRSTDGDFAPSQAWLYWNIIEWIGSGHADFREWCVAGLGRLGKIDWMNDLAGGCENIWLAHLLVNDQSKPAFSAPFADALVAHAKESATGNQIPEEAVLDIWTEILSFIEPSLLSQFSSDLLSVAMEGGGKTARDFFNLYGGMISDPEMLLSAPKIIERLFTPIVNERNLAGLKWVIGLLETDSKFLKALSKNDGIDGLLTRLRYYVETPGEDESQALIGELADLLGISVEPAQVIPDSSEGIDVEVS